MDKEDSLLVDLREQYKNKDWYGDVGYDQFGRPVLYIKYDCHETIWDIPDKCDGKQLMVHYLANKTARADGFMDKPQEKPITNRYNKPALTAQQFIDAAHEANKKAIDTGFGQMLDDLPGIDQALDEAEKEKMLEMSVQALTNELDRLERLCGSNILQDIFYEVHDKDNAVTNLSAKFPEVRTRVEKLYDKYGFDIIYDELDG